MSDSFDPYHRWLGISPKDQPPNHYRLLGVDTFEDDPNVIESAADRQMAHVRTFQTGKHSELTQRILNELAQAKLVLLHEKRKAEYDRALRAELQPELSPSESLPSESPLAEPEPPQQPQVRVIPLPQAQRKPPTSRPSRVAGLGGIEIPQIAAAEQVARRTHRKRPAWRRPAWVGSAVAGLVVLGALAYFLSPGGGPRLVSRAGPVSELPGDLPGTPPIRPKPAEEPAQTPEQPTNPSPPTTDPGEIPGPPAEAPGSPAEVPGLPPETPVSPMAAPSEPPVEPPQPSVEPSEPATEPPDPPAEPSETPTDSPETPTEPPETPSPPVDPPSKPPETRPRRKPGTPVRSRADGSFPGLVGRVSVRREGENSFADAGFALQYEPGSSLHDETLRSLFAKRRVAGDRVELTLWGTLQVSKPTTVVIRHKGGSGANSSLRLLVDGKDFGSVGNDRSAIYETELSQGDHAVQWVVFGDNLGRGSLVEFLDKETNRPVPVMCPRQMAANAGASSSAAPLCLGAD
ncbi:MAG: hypothetical protein JXB62_16620 [Pirellulales bacterium]|nr:hypothetical protein [Pirellulales bacterium]